MASKIGINGFGRIGRSVLRQAVLKNSPLEIVVINDLASPADLAHLFKYDSVHGRFPGTVSAGENYLEVNGKKIAITSWKSPAQAEWSKHGVEVVLECSGRFTTREQCTGHLQQGGAKKVIVSAPAKEIDLTVVLGVNEKSYDSSKHHIISNASCTTNCLAPLVKVLHDQLKVKKGMMTTVHSYTNDQRILDVHHEDMRRARAAAVSQIPTTTGAAKAIGLVIPDLKGKIDGLAIRVPTPNVSLVDFVCEVSTPTTIEQINGYFKQASETYLKGILAYSDEPLVSSDYNGNPSSSTIDSLLTNVIDGTLVKVVSWYDNETGFSARMIELAEYITK